MPNLVALVLVLAWAYWAFGYHIKHKPTEAQSFGCEHTYINKRGEDTGECN